MKIFTYISLFLFLLPITILAQTEEDQSFKKDVKRLFESNGSKELYLASLPQIISTFKNMRTDIPDKIWDELEKEMSGESINELMDMLIPVYQNHFSHEEIKELISFYESPIGKKLAVKMPEITKESMNVGQQWGMQIGIKLGKKLEEKGY